MSEILMKLRNKSTFSFIPLQASLELTNRCNERCSHCYIPKFADDPKRVLSLNQWYLILQKLKDAGSLYLILMGGESMLSPYFWPLLKRSSELNFHTSIITNGLKIRSLEDAEKLADYGLNDATFSIYSLDPKIHDKMTRVKGSHKRTTAAIDYCIQAGVGVSLNCLITKNNIAGIFDMYQWAEDKGVQFKADPIITSKLDGDLSPTKLRASKEQLKWFYAEKAKRWPSGRPRAEKENPQNFICNAAKGKCAVTAYGELLSCIEIRKPLGSLVEKSFAELWASVEANRWRNLKIKDLTDPLDSEKQSLCDHCPGMSLNEQGDPLKQLSFSKELAEIKYEVATESN